MLILIARMIESLSEQIRKIEIELMAWHRTNQTCRRLETIPGIGFITATALAATVVDAKVFRLGRQFAAWLGLVPRQNSTGGKERMGGISKMGDRYLRHLLVVGPPRSCATHVARRPLSAFGQTNCWNVRPPDWLRLLSPTRWRGSPGQLWRARKITAG